MTDAEINELADKIFCSHWNYRWLKIELDIPKYNDNFEPTGDTDKEHYYELHEVYYDEKNNPILWTEDTIRLQFDDAEGIMLLLQKALNATDKKVLMLKDNTLIELDEYMDKREVLEQYRKEN